MLYYYKYNRIKSIHSRLNNIFWINSRKALAKSRYIRYYSMHNETNDYTRDDFYDTVIEENIYSRLFVCAKCNCICLKPNDSSFSNPLKDKYINDVYVTSIFFGNHDIYGYHENRFSWIYDKCSARLDKRIKYWIHPPVEEGDNHYYRKEPDIFEGCDNSVVHIWNYNKAYRVYFLYYSEFVEGDFSMDEEYIYFMRDRFLYVKDMSDEYIQFSWVVVKDDIKSIHNALAKQNFVFFKSFGSIIYYGDFLFEKKKDRLVIESDSLVRPPMFFNYIYRKRS